MSIPISVQPPQAVPLAIIPPPKRVMSAINKARKACMRAAGLCADADAEVATYWKTDGRSLRPNAWHTHNLRQLAAETFGQAHELQLHAEWALAEAALVHVAKRAKS